MVDQSYPQVINIVIHMVINIFFKSQEYDFYRQKGQMRRELSTKNWVPIIIYNIFIYIYKDNDDTI